jgi:hypothetical protein
MRVLFLYWNLIGQIFRSDKCAIYRLRWTQELGEIPSRKMSDFKAASECTDTTEWDHATTFILKQKSSTGPPTFQPYPSAAAMWAHTVDHGKVSQMAGPQDSTERTVRPGHSTMNVKVTISFRRNDFKGNAWLYMARLYEVYDKKTGMKIAALQRTGTEQWIILIYL